MSKPTPKQAAARDRNWRIFRTRALWHQATMLSPVHRVTVQRAIDTALAEMGAEPETVRDARKRAEYDRPIPF